MLEAELQFTSKSLLNILPFPLYPEETKPLHSHYGEEPPAGRTSVLSLLGGSSLGFSARGALWCLH